MKKVYPIINITLIVLALYVLTFPLWSKIIESISPQLSKCVFLQLKGYPCPFCGSTTYLNRFWNGELLLKDLFDIKFVLLGCLVFNIIFRGYAMISKYKYIYEIIKVDMIINTTVGILLLIYAMQFFIEI